MNIAPDHLRALSSPPEPPSHRPVLILSDAILSPEGVVSGGVLCADGLLVAVGAEIAPEDARGAMTFDARGLLVAPALVDIHGDAFERQLQPRPGVDAPRDVALIETDRQLAAAGIATAYHALTLGWEPGLRSVATAEAVLDGLGALAPRLGVEHRAQLRWEVFADEAQALVRRALAGPLTPSLAFNDHTSMALRPAGQRVQDRAPDCDPARPVIAFDAPELRARIASHAKRSGLDEDAYLTLLRAVWERRDATPDAVRAMAEAARAAGAPMLSHDDNSPAIRAHYRALGAGVAEFPMNVETAEAARAAGDLIVFGAPNAMRGGSHLGSPGAAEMTAAGLCDILASDYHYPAMLAAAHRLHRRDGLSLERAWDLVSGAPARASGLSDRGALAPGLRADIVAVEWPEGSAPAVRLTLSRGRIAHCCGLAPG